MPDLGGKKFAEDFKSMLQREIASAFADGRSVIAQATRELTDTIKEQSRGAASVIRAEARTIKEAFEPTTGNNPPDTEEKAGDKVVDLKNPTSQKSEGEAA